MEEKLDLILNEIKELKNEIEGLKDEVKGVKSENKGLKGEVKGLSARMDIVEKRLDAQGKQIANNFNTLNDKIDQVAIELRQSIFNLGNEIRKEIRDFKEVNGRQHLEMSEHFEYLYQESKNDREELHQSVNELSKAHKLNRIDIDKLIAKC